MSRLLVSLIILVFASHINSKELSKPEIIPSGLVGKPFHIFSGHVPKSVVLDNPIFDKKFDIFKTSTRKLLESQSDDTTDLSSTDHSDSPSEYLHRPAHLSFSHEPKSFSDIPSFDEKSNVFETHARKLLQSDSSDTYQFTSHPSQKLVVRPQPIPFEKSSKPFHLFSGHVPKSLPNENPIFDKKFDLFATPHRRLLETAVEVSIANSSFSSNYLNPKSSTNSVKGKLSDIRPVAISFDNLVEEKPQVFKNVDSTNKGKYNIFRSSKGASKYDNRRNGRARKSIFVEEITKPVTAPRGTKVCAFQMLVTRKEFGSNSVPLWSTYTPPKACSTGWGLVKLTITGKSDGLQFNRILDIYFDGLHVVRTSTPGSFRNGTTWGLEKDITKFSAFLTKPRSVLVSLPNYVTMGFTGKYVISVKITFYPGISKPDYADVIIPITNASLDSMGFSSHALTNYSNSMDESFTLPRNAYRAVLEVVTTPRGTDQLLAFSLPTHYSTSIPYVRTSGVYREIQISIDDQLAGFFVPKSVLNPANLFPEYWTRLVGIGVFHAPSYTVDVSPFVGQLVDGETHKLTVRIPEISRGSKWHTSLILHVWVDTASSQTTGRLLSSKISSGIVPKSYAALTDMDSCANVAVSSKRWSQYVGQIETSFGNFTTKVTNQLEFSNFFKARAGTQTLFVDQEITTSSKVTMEKSGDKGKYWISLDDVRSYPLKVLTEGFTTIDGAYMQKYNYYKSMLYHGQPRKTERLSNVQSAFGFRDYLGNVGGATVTQNFTFRSNYDGCYSRKYDASVFGLLEDTVSYKC